MDIIQVITQGLKRPTGLTNSLKFRLILSAALMILMVLPLIGFTLSNAFEQKLTQSIKRELSAYSYAILAVAEVENNQLLMPEQLLENQFNIAQSGLYATITKHTASQYRVKDPSIGFDPLNNLVQEGRDTLWQSNSLLGLIPPNNLTNPEVGAINFSRILLSGLQLENKVHFVYSFTVSFSSYFNKTNTDFPLTIHVIKSLSDFEQLLLQFQQQLWAWLLVLMILLMFVQVFWLLWTLKPLHELKKELEKIEQGKLDRLQKNYPMELTQVTNQLNLLLATEQGQRKRYRNALADLAHSLKTPLAVMQSEGELSHSAQQQLVVVNQIIEHQLKRAQSAGESSWHLGVNVDDIVTKLLSSLAKIYYDKGLTFIKNTDSIDAKPLIFKGDEADLLEILGNLLDNACKAAKTTVSLTAKVKDACLLISVSDDGLGLTKEQKSQVLHRGMRADTYPQGHGIGLAIVSDLVSSYQGELSINQSEQWGGAEFILSFTYK